MVGPPEQHNKQKGKKSITPNQILNNDTQSEVTIYRNALIDGTKRISSSSKEGMEDMNEDMIDIGIPSSNQVNPELINQFILGQRQRVDEIRRGEELVDVDDAQPSTSRGKNPQPKTPEQRATEIIMQAEAAKARVFETPGEQIITMERDNHNQKQSGNVLAKQAGFWDCDLKLCSDCVHSAMVDEHYIMVGLHVDEATRNKITQGEYIDFAKLIQRGNKIQQEENNRYQMVFKGGQQYYVPVANNSGITSYLKWEQAFRVFTSIYIKAFPQRAGELVQYNHLIHTAAQTYSWENVYNYDKDFRLHLSIFPNRSWSITLQHTWNVHMKDKIKSELGHNDNKYDPGSGNKDGCCRRFHKGKCTFGLSCKYDHRCKYCGKWGHGTINCRKLKSDKNGMGFSPVKRGRANGIEKQDFRSESPWQKLDGKK